MFPYRRVCLYEYKCPPCPPGAICSPCASNHIIITVDKDRSLNTTYDISKDLYIYTEEYRHFKLGKPYIFSFKRVGETFYAGTDKEFIQYTNQLVGYNLNEDE